MDRRRYLALLGTIAMAGCSEAEPSTGSTNTPADTATPTPIDTPTRTETETATPEPTETATETETPEPDPNVQTASERLARAIYWLDEGVAAWAGFADHDIDQPTIVDVNAASEFDPGEITSKTTIADDNIDSAERLAAEELGAEIDAARRIYTFVHVGARLQNRLALVHESFQEGLTDFYGGEYQLVASSLSSMRTDLDVCEDYLLDVSTGSGAEYSAHLDAIDAELHQSKIDQFKREVDAFNGLHSAMGDLADVMPTFDTAVFEYFDGDDDYIGFAAGLFDSARSDIGQAPEPDSVAEEMSDLHSLTLGFGDAAGHLDDATDARESNNSDAAGRLECRAREAVMEYDDWRDFRAAREIFEESNCPG